MAITAVMVVVWAGVASGTNGDALKVGQATSATAQTTLNTTQGSGNGLQVNLSGSTTGAAIRANATGSGGGLFATSSSPNAAAVQGVQNSPTHGTGAAGSFGGGQNNGVTAGTGNANSFGVRAASNAASHGTGAAGLFLGNHNDGAVASTADGSSVAVKGTNSAGGRALAGISDAAGGTGVYAEANDASGTAVVGSSNSGTAIAALTGGGGPSLLATNSGTGPAAAFQVGSGVPPFTVNSSTQVPQLNADQVDGLDANQLARFNQTAWSFIVNPSDGDTFGTVHITTTQSQEYVLAQAMFYTGINAGQPSSAFPCRAPFLLRVDGTVPFQNRSLVAAAASPSGDYLFQNQALQAGFLVGPGDHTIDVQVVRESGTCNFFIGYGELGIQSIPFGATGGTPTTPVGPRAQAPAAPKQSTPR
jgi:hypothetical protein